MGYVQGKYIYHCEELSKWTRDDFAHAEYDDAQRHIELSLMERVFHEWKERKQLTTWRATYYKSLVERYGEKCACCGATNVKLHIDHKTPISKGGITAGDNLQLLCQNCNSAKSDKLYYEWLKERTE